MPTAQTKQIGICNEIILDQEGTGTDLSADAVSFSPALLRTMLDSNQVGFKVMDVVHGAFDFLVTFVLDNRQNTGLNLIFEPYFQGTPPFLLSMTFREDVALAVSATNQLWVFVNGKTGTIPGPNVAFNTVEQTTFEVRFTDIGKSDVAGTTFTSIIDGTTVITLIADAAPP